MMTRRELGALAVAAITAPRRAVAQGASAQSAANPAGPVLDIAEWSYKFYGVEHALLARGTVCNGMQMYVEHWIPAQVRHPYPVVLIHGGYGQGSDWFSTPDGRRGWATLLLEQGYKVYVVDRPGRAAIRTSRSCTETSIAKRRRFEARSRAMGIVPPTRRPGGRASGRVDGPANGQQRQTREVWRTRGAMLLDDIGPAILVTHGDGAAFALGHRSGAA